MKIKISDINSLIKSTDSPINILSELPRRAGLFALASELPRRAGLFALASELPSKTGLFALASELISNLPIVLIAIILAIITWYIITSISTVLVVENSNKIINGKKSCDFK